MVLARVNIMVLVTGCFMETIAIMMITSPILMPIITSLDFNPVGFGGIMLVNCGARILTPFSGLLLFAVKELALEEMLAWA
jgi:C4-dicarboxylate transporter DctM subunit